MIKKDFVTPNTGATATVHVVTTVQIDYSGSNLTTATVSSFLDADAQTAGKWPLYTQSIPLEGRPADGQDARDYAEALLVQAAADGATSVYANRYAFAGGELIQDPTAAQTVATQE